MPDEIALGCAVDRNQDERNYDNGQDDVRDQYGKVKRPNDSLSQEISVAMIVMVSQVGNQETSRRHQGGNLTVPVRSNQTGADKTVARYQKQSAGSVQEGI